MRSPAVQRRFGHWHGTAHLQIYDRLPGRSCWWVPWYMRATVYLRPEQGYLPLPLHLRAATLARKREEYASLVELAFARGREGLDQQIWHQIEIDVPRTRPGVQLWMQAATQRVTISICLPYTTKL